MHGSRCFYRRSQISMNDFLMIGTVLKPQGIRGECKIRSYASDISMFSQWNTLYIKKEYGFSPLHVRTVRIRDDFVFAVLNEAVTPEEADKYRGLDLYVDRQHAAPAKEGSELIADLIGCKAFDENGVLIGTLTEVLQYGTVDTWVFHTGEGTLMAPALRNVFPEVNVSSREILVIRDRLEEVAVRS